MTEVYGLKTGLFNALFLSVSAFTNAGFDPIGSSSLLAYAADPLVNLTVMTLIIFGGLGFVVWFELYDLLKSRFVKGNGIVRRHTYLSVHAKTVLKMTVSLLFSGAALFYVFESENSGYLKTELYSFTTEQAPAPEPVVVPTLTLKAPALEFKDMIKVIAFFTAENLDDVVEMGMLTYTEKVDVIDVNTATHVIPGADYEESSGRYFASSQGIHAKFLGDTVYLACYAKLTDGTYVYTKLAPYSPITYATNQLKNSTNTALKQLVAAMLNYGAAAQNYFSYNTEVLANSTLTAEQIALPKAYRADMVASAPAAPAAKQGIFANNKGFSVRKPAVSFEGAFSINYFFTPAYTPADGITLYYWTEADFNATDVLTVDNATGAIDMVIENGQYRADIEGIAAKDLSKTVYVAAVYSDGTTTWTSGVLGYSIGAYCSSQATKGGTMADLAKATAVYGYHAKAYFG
jgi:hypothetical protein